MAQRITVTITLSSKQLESLDMMVLEAGTNRAQIVSDALEGVIRHWDYCKSVEGIPFLDPFYEYDDEFYAEMDNRF